MASISRCVSSFELEPLRCNVITNTGSGRQEYPYPSDHVDVDTTSFVSVKLSGETNYDLWQEQMMRLLESHGMQGFIDGTFKNPKENDPDSKEKDMEAKYMEWKRSDTLAKEWILGSLSEEVISSVVGLDTAYDIWSKLKNTRYTPAPPTITTTITSTTDNRELAEYLPLCRAIVSGNWEEAKRLLNQGDRDVFTAKLDSNGYTAMHHAIETMPGENLDFVRYLLEHIDAESLPTMIETSIGSNPLHAAAMVGHTEAAMMLVDKNPRLLFGIDYEGKLPVRTSVASSHRTTSLYLLHACKQPVGLSQQDGYYNPFDHRNGPSLLISLINEGYVDIAYDLIKEYPGMAVASCDVKAPLSSLGAKFDFYYSGTRYNSYERFVYSHVLIENNNLSDTHKVQDIENQYQYKCTRRCFHDVIMTINVKFWKFALLHVLHIKHLKDDKVNHDTTLKLLRCICEEIGKTDRRWDDQGVYSATTLAAINDTPEVIKEVVRYFPKALWSYLDDYSLIQLAIINRSEKVYKLLVHQNHMSMNTIKGLVNADGNNLLHLAGRLAPIHKLNVVSGAALQMQRELQWFQEVEKFVQPKKKEATNKIKETPMTVFRREHKELRKEGEEWMKKTADSYTITAALIITIVFAAAITVPGGNDDNTGKVIYLTRPSFIIFAISDAISLFTSTTSLLLFLSILTARYRDEDFLYRLPKRLILGLAMLFLSVTSMMVAFSATLYIMFGEGKAWILIPIAALTCLPITSFVTLQFPMLAELISSTYGRGIFGKQNGRRNTYHKVW